MGLFRRGTQLLKLGSGLRDCCCRPEKPEECWCPDWCRFSWYWPGMDVVSLTRTFKSVSCIQFDPKLESAFFGYFPDPPFAGAYGLIKADTPQQFRTGFIDIGTADALFSSEETYFAFNHGRTGDIEPFGNIFGLPATRAGYITFLAFRLYCKKKDVLTESNALFLEVTLRQEVVASRLAFNASFIPLYIFWGTSEIEIPSVCVNNQDLQCNEPYVTALQPEQNLEIELDQTGVTVNGNSSAWTPYLAAGLFTANGDSWEVENEYPLATTVTLTVASCQAAPCDCNAVLSGIPVQFEGREFTYGAGDEFISDDGATRWVESSPGLFYRYDYDPCDYSQQFVANQKTANVFCTNVDGQDYWAVVLTNECYERSSCGGGYDAARAVQWSGLFSCSEGGFPEGFPHSASDAADPPDFLYDIPSDPAPTEECAGDVAIPSFRFLAND
jgi:hypothetical protein